MTYMNLGRPEQHGDDCGVGDDSPSKVNPSAQDVNLLGVAVNAVLGGVVGYFFALLLLGDASLIGLATFLGVVGGGLAYIINPVREQSSQSDTVWSDFWEQTPKH